MMSSRTAATVFWLEQLIIVGTMIAFVTYGSASSSWWKMVGEKVKCKKEI